MAATDENSNAVLQGLARHINCLGEDNKIARRKALESIKKDTVDRKPPLSDSELKSLFNDLLKPLLKEFSDPMERCREISVNTVKKFLSMVPSPEDSLPYIMPVLVQRLGQPDIVEPSEELRLQVVELLKEIIESSGKKKSVYLDDVIRILQRTILDPYPEVKKLSCHCASSIAKSVPEYFHAQSESLIKPLLLSISHQHAKVRTLVIQTIGDVIQYGNGKSVDTVVSHLAQRLFDQTPAVRMAVTKVVGNWMLDLMDRYSFWHKLMPLLLTSITDEQPEIREVADSLWYDIGLKYQQENEDDLKDKMDFAKPEPTHYPPNVERPNLGCRTLMMRNLSKILPGLMRDVCDWVVDTRVKSASLLYTLLLNAEEYVTQHMEVLTSGMFRACADEDQRVVKDIQKAAELIGYFVDVEVWSKMILKSVVSTQSYTSLMILASVVRGTERSALKPYVQSICDTITHPDVCQSVQVSMQIQLLNCVDSLLSVSQTDITESSTTSQSIFNLLHTILALQQGEVITEKETKTATRAQMCSKISEIECFTWELAALEQDSHKGRGQKGDNNWTKCRLKNLINLLLVYELLDRLSSLHGLNNRFELYRTHTKPLLDSFQDSYTVWSTHSVERLIFDILVIEAGPVVGELLDDIIPILTANFSPEKDPEVRLKFFSLLSNLMMKCKDTLDSQNKFADFAQVVVRDMILPNCVWKAGRIAGAIRTTAVSCAWALLQSGVLTKDKLEPVLDTFITQMLSLMDDDNKGTRLVACRVMTRTFDLCGMLVDQDRLHNMYLELLKRLDDSNDEIRVTVSKTFLAYLDCFQEKYDVGLYRAHLEAMYKGLLVHLDDPEEKIQEAILAVLKKAGSLMPGMLIMEVENTKHKHRSKKYCDELVSHLQQLSTGS